MNIHKNARLTPLRREEMALSVMEGAFSKAHAARVYGVSAKIVARWVERYKAEGRVGMVDRSSRPAHMPQVTAASTAERIGVLRRQRWTGKHIAMEVGVSPATVSRVLRRAGLSRLTQTSGTPSRRWPSSSERRSNDPSGPRDLSAAVCGTSPSSLGRCSRRYERENPGEMIHIDIKKLGRFSQVGHRITGDPQKGKSRGAGWEFVHVCIDDASRIAFSQILADEKKESAIAFLKAAVAYYASLGVSIARVMTDNGSCYRSKAFAKACRDLGLKHVRTRPYTPKTNGKAERFIQTALREWAYAIAYPTSNHRAAELPVWLHRYNWHRPHGSLKSKTPISRLALTEDNLLRLHT